MSMIAIVGERRCCDVAATQSHEATINACVNESRSKTAKFVEWRFHLGIGMSNEFSTGSEAIKKRLLDLCHKSVALIISELEKRVGHQIPPDYAIHFEEIRGKNNLHVHIFLQETAQSKRTNAFWLSPEARHSLEAICDNTLAA